jgi:hypothetical protein
VKLDSVKGLKQQLLNEIVTPLWAPERPSRSRGTAAAAASLAAGGIDAVTTPLGVGAKPIDTLPEVHRTIALGVARRQKGAYRLAVRVQRPSLLHGPMIEHVTREARGEVDVRLVGRIDKRSKARRVIGGARRTAVPAVDVSWYQLNTRPLLIGASIGHVKVTAGSIGAFVTRGGGTFVLSNNHVLANEDHAVAGDWIVQRGTIDGGRSGERVARLGPWIRLKMRGVNFVDCALGRLEAGIVFDGSRLRGLVNGRDRALAGLGPEFVDEGEVVFKIGRTTGARKGRVTAFDVDNVVVNYDVGNLRFDNQIEIEGAGHLAFSDGGDSGSLIVNPQMQAIALLFAGADSGGANGMGLTYANPMQRVLRDLKATLLFSS